MRHPLPMVAAMGTKNRQRRAAKARQRARQHERRRTSPTARPPTTVRQLLWLAATDHGPDSLTALDLLTTADATLVSREAESLILLAVGAAVGQRVAAGRSGEARASRRQSCRAADGRGRGRRSHPPGPRRRCIRAGRRRSSRSISPTSVRRPVGSPTSPEPKLLHHIALVQAIVAALAAAYGAGRLHTIIPPPGAPGSRSMADHDPAINDPVLLKVRALLAQAESTTFEAEAEAFTAKAQELMARHAIDAALLWSTAERGERPSTIRIPIDDPYVDIKSLPAARRRRPLALQGGVGRPARAWRPWSGSPPTSPAPRCCSPRCSCRRRRRCRPKAPRPGPAVAARSRSFRSSFLMAFTQRIDQRLAEINHAVEQAVEAESSGSLLPVLASRESAVEDEVAAVFGDLVMTSVRGGSDAAGWARGRLAADLAELNTPLQTSTS